MLARIEELPELVKRHRIDVVYLSLPMVSGPRIQALLDALRDTTASVYFVPDMFVTDLIQGRVDSVSGMPVLGVFDSPFTGVSGLVKRASDIVLSLLILALVAPLLLVLALLVKLTSPGPAIFRQRRYGLDGEEIVVYKLRTMTVTEDGDSIRQCAQARPARDAARRVPAPHLARRAAAARQRAAGTHEPGRPAAARGRAQRALPQADQGLHAAPQGAPRPHRLGAGERPARRDRSRSRR